MFFYDLYTIIYKEGFIPGVYDEASIIIHNNILRHTQKGVAQGYMTSTALLYIIIYKEGFIPGVYYEASIGNY